MNTRVLDLPFDPAALHELCVASLGGGGAPMEPAMALALAASFASAERWREEFTAMGKAPADGARWVVLAYQPREGTLSNQWVADPAHDMAGGVPILALDMDEHAYRLEPSADVDAFMDNIDWARVHARFQGAVQAASEPFGVDSDALGDALLIDVRRAGVFEQAQALIPGACWRDPIAVSAWGGQLPAAREWVVYCVRGHEVSRAAAMRLRALGLNARYLRGGIEGWQAAGRPLADKLGEMGG